MNSFEAEKFLKLFSEIIEKLDLIESSISFCGLSGIECQLKRIADSLEKADMKK